MTEPNGTIGFRLDRLEKDVDRLYAMKPEVVADQVKSLHDDIADVRNEVKGVRKALWGTALSVSAGAVIFAVTSFQLFGHA